MLNCILLLDYKFALCKYDISSKSVGLVCAIGSSFMSSMWNPCLLYVGYPERKFRWAETVLTPHRGLP
jgi:hypothetical protein